MNPLKKELWRLKLNWLYIVLLEPLFSISQVGTPSSFHQFVTNPRARDVQNTTNQEFAPGLEESEFFYSLLIAAFELGAMVGGLLSGFLLRCVPYWYLYSTAILSHIVGYVLYSVGNTGWLILISRLLAGYILGAMITLGFIYLGATSETYVETQRKLGIETNEDSVENAKNLRFATITIGSSVGYILGPGVAVIFAQFESVDQFRAIGWYNVAYGVVGLILLVVMFHGEIKCNKLDQCFKFGLSGKSDDSATNCKLGLLASFHIILSLIVFSFVERVRFAVLQTLFNPIASDSFGLDEKDTSYIFLVLAFPKFAGAILLLIFQRLRVPNQVIVIFGILTTMSGYLLLTDWQAIPYDPCTEYSPFHHPELAHPTDVPVNQTLSKMLATQSITDIQFSRGVELILQDGATFTFESSFEFSCNSVETCGCGSLFPTSVPHCVNFTVDEKGQFTRLVDSVTKYYLKQEAFRCYSKLNQLVSICVYLTRISSRTKEVLAVSESIGILPENIYFIVRNNCIEANVTGHKCHWIPSSDIANKECEDCPPICRSVHQTLTFAQFCLGIGLLVFSSSLQFPPTVALLMNQTPKSIQGIVVGLMTAMNNITRTVSPLIMDALYERMQKRTFVFTIIMAVIHIPFLIEIIVLYRRLGPKTQNTLQYSKLQQDETEGNEP